MYRLIGAIGVFTDLTFCVINYVVTFGFGSQFSRIVCGKSDSLGIELVS